MEHGELTNLIEHLLDGSDARIVETLAHEADKSVAELIHDMIMTEVEFFEMARNKEGGRVFYQKYDRFFRVTTHDPRSE